MTNASATQRVAPGNVNDHLTGTFNGIAIDKDSLAAVQHFAKSRQELAPFLAQVRDAGAVPEKVDNLAIDTESTSDGGSDLSAEFQGLIIEPITAWLPQSESLDMILKFYDNFYDIPDEDDELLHWFPPLSCQSLSIDKGSGCLLSPDYPKVHVDMVVFYDYSEAEL